MIEANPTVNAGLLARLRPWLFGYDVFISYRRSEALGYALALERELIARDLVCFRDVAELPAGSKFEKDILRALKRSRTLVVVGTPAVLNAADGRWVRKEVSDFRALRPESPIIVVNVDGAISRATWPEVADGTWLNESRPALDPPDPAISVLDGIYESLRFFRVNRLLRWLVSVVVVFIASLTIGIAVTLTRSAEQAKVAAALELAANADAVRESGAGAIADSARLALRGAQSYASVVTDRSLRATASLLPSLLASIDAPCGKQFASMSPNRRYVAFGRDSRACVLDLQQQSAWELDLGFSATLPSETPRLRAIAFAADGSSLWVAHGALLNDTTLTRISIATWMTDAEVDVEGTVTVLGVAPDGDWLVAGTFTGALFAGNENFERIRDPEDPTRTNRVRQIDFDLNTGRLIVELDSGLEVWTGWQESATRSWMRASGGVLASVPFAVDHNRGLLVTTGPGTVEVLGLDDYEARQVLYLADVDRLHLTEDGTLYAEADGQIHTWHRPVEHFVRRTVSPIPGEAPFGGRFTTTSGGSAVLARQESGAALFSADGQLELARYYFDGTLWHGFSVGDGAHLLTLSDNHVRVWGDSVKRSGGARFPRGSWLFADVAISHDGGTAILVRHAPGMPLTHSVLEFWDMGSAEKIAERHIPYRPGAVLLNPSTLRYAAGGRLWQWSDWADEGDGPRAISEFPAAVKPCEPEVAFSADGRVAVGFVGRNRLWIRENGEYDIVEIAQVRIRCADKLVLSASGEWLALSYQGTVGIVNLRTRRLESEISTQYTVRNMDFDAGAKRLALATALPPESDRYSGVASVEIRSVPDGALVDVVSLDGRTIAHSVCMSPDGTRFASLIKGVTQIWSLRGRRPGASLESVLPRVPFANLCQFSTDGTSIDIGGYRGVWRHQLATTDVAAQVSVALALPSEQIR